MKRKIVAKPNYATLKATGLVSPSYATELASGIKIPSLEMARKIEEATGYPIGSWRIGERA